MIIEDYIGKVKIKKKWKIAVTVQERAERLINSGNGQG